MDPPVHTSARACTIFTVQNLHGNGLLIREQIFKAWGAMRTGISGLGNRSLVPGWISIFQEGGDIINTCGQNVSSVEEIKYNSAHSMVHNKTDFINSVLIKTFAFTI